MLQHKNKICFAAGEFFPTVGGLSNSATRIAKMLSSSGFDIHVIVPVQGKITELMIVPEEMNGLLVYRVPVGVDVQKSNGTSLVKVIRQLDKDLNFDLFHGFFLPMAYACCLGMNKINRPLISSIRGSDAKIWATPAMKNLLKLVLKKTSCLTSVNNALLPKILKASKVDVDTKFIKNSIELKSDKKWDIQKMISGKIGTLGKFQKCKEIDVLLDSYKEIDDNLKSNLTLIGDFPNEELKLENKSKIEILKLKKEVTLTGYLNKEEVIENLVNLNVFVSTSSSEGFPNALLEAASLGVPIVVAAFEGIEDYCEDGKNVLTVPVGDVKATSDAITSILTNKELAKRLSKGAIELAKSLTPETEKQQWIYLYKNLLGNNSKTNFLKEQYV